MINRAELQVFFSLEKKKKSFKLAFNINQYRDNIGHISIPIDIPPIGIDIHNNIPIVYYYVYQISGIVLKSQSSC